MKPTVLSPLYVVQRVVTINDGWEMEYYTEVEGGEPFRIGKQWATLFPSLHTASRVAQAETAEVRVLVTEEEYKEFRSGK